MALRRGYHGQPASARKNLYFFRSLPANRSSVRNDSSLDRFGIKRGPEVRWRTASRIARTSARPLPSRRWHLVQRCPWVSLSVRPACRRVALVCCGRCCSSRSVSSTYILTSVAMVAQTPSGMCTMAVPFLPPVALPLPLPLALALGLLTMLSVMLLVDVGNVSSGLSSVT